MINFQYYNPCEIIFGKDSEKNIGSYLAKYNCKNLLLVYSGDFIKTLGIFDTIKNSCEQLGISFYENGQVVPNPKIELVRELVDLCKCKNVDFIVAVGGGSSIDTAKAVSIGACYSGDVWNFFEGSALPKKAIPIGVITTIPASGSETSNCTIISNGLAKLGFEDNLVIPKFAIMNPSFTMGLPAYQTSCGIADILSHLLERYFTQISNVDTTDYLLEGAMQALMVNAYRVMENPENYDARAEIQWLASIAHNNLLDTGRASDWASHRIEHELSAQYGITHGEGMAVIFIAWIKYMAEKAPFKLAQLANRVFAVDSFNHTQTEMAYLLCEKLEFFFRKLNLKTTLSQLNIDSKDFTKMALRATKNNTVTVGQYMPLNAEMCVDVLNLAL